MYEIDGVTLKNLGDAALKLAEVFKGGDVVLFVAEMGAGKTTFISELAKALDISDQITSPTFTIMETYQLQEPINDIKKLIHIDTYRLAYVNELYDLGFETIFSDDALTVIEWGERIEEFIGKDHYVICIDEVDDDTRNISMHFIEASHD